jgi:hypothetical protein
VIAKKTIRKAKKPAKKKICGHELNLMAQKNLFAC